MTAKTDDKLFDAVRRHVDDDHPDLGLTDEAIQIMISDEARDAG
jgi:hypothetical protein